MNDCLFYTLVPENSIYYPYPPFVSDRVILDIYKQSKDQSESSQDAYGWLDELAVHLSSAGISGEGEADTALASMLKAGIKEEQARILF